MSWTDRYLEVLFRKPGADPRLFAAIVDRLTFGGITIDTGTDSYRLAQSKQLRG